MCNGGKGAPLENPFLGMRRRGSPEYAPAINVFTLLFIPRKGEKRGRRGERGEEGGPDKDTVTHFERHGKTPTSLGKGMSCK